MNYKDFAKKTSEGKNLQDLIDEAKRLDEAREKKTKSRQQKKEEEALAILEYESRTPEIKPEPQKFKQLEHNPDKEWDVTLQDKIEYFDPTLSYELTGYRPITKTEGLDFNPKLFTQAADSYRQNKRYTMYAPGTFRNKQFWTEEWNRCVNGYTVGKYRLTGENYFWLNYYRLESNISEEVSEGQVRTEDFPGFLAKQYEYFHYLELVRLLKRDSLVFKARGVGVSEIAASNTVYQYTFHKGSSGLITAYIEDYVKATLQKCWLQLSFLNTNTDGEFRHVRMKLDTDMHKRASKVDKDKNETGWMADIKGITHDSPRKLRGFRVNSIYFEECFSPDTKVIMSDYSRKRIEDIKVGDFVMGIDGTPQEVIKTNSGNDNLCLVKQLKGEDYIVTSNHKLYLEHRPRVGNQKDKIELLTPLDYFELSNYNKRTTYGLKSSGLQFNQTLEDLDPYFLGVWLGDGDKTRISIIINESADPEIRDYVIKYYNNNLGSDHHITIKQDTKCKLGLTHCNLRHYSFVGNIKGPNQNKLLKVFKKYNLIDNKHIPKEVYYTPIEYRLKVLAGLIDTDGNLSKGSSSYSFSYEIAMARESLINEIAELARSCGFYVHQDYRKIPNGYKKNSDSYRICIRGDLNRIPVLVARKKLPIDYKQTSNPLSTSIKIENYGYGKYCGITLRSYGKSTDNLFLLNDYTVVHNCGSDPVLEKTYIQAEALVKVGGKRIGSRFLQGTGGDTGESLAALNKMFYDPEGYKILPYKNTYGRDQQVQYTGYFIPAYTMWFGDDDGNIGFDERGVVDEEMAKAHFIKEFEKYKDPHALLLSRAEYCFTPEDAFILEGANRFDQELLIDQYNALTLHKTIEPPKSIRLSWNIDKEQGTADKSSKPRIEFIADGPLKITELPMEDPTGHAYSNLYVAGIDAIDTDSSTSTGQTDVSNFCMVVMRRAFGTQPPKIVAIYKERPTHIQTAFENALKLCTLYNCKVLVEATRISIKQYFEKEHKLDFLMRRPQSTANSTKKTNFKQYGVPATEAIIQHQLDLIEQFIVDYSDQIQFPEMLQELMKYSYENKRKFDIVAAFGICLLADEDMIGKVAKASNYAVKKISFGYTKNEYGQIGWDYEKVNNYGSFKEENIESNGVRISAQLYQPYRGESQRGSLYP